MAPLLNENVKIFDDHAAERRWQKEPIEDKDKIYQSTQ